MDILNCERNIEELLSLLHGENPTQYYTLIKMHLSFATDLATDQCDGSFDSSSANTSKWNLSPIMRRFLRVNSNNRQSSENPLQSQDVVLQVFNLIDFLSRNENIVQEGLFRKTGSVARQNELKAALLLGNALNLECRNYSAHDCASVLKSFFADLPEPLLQEGQYHVHCRIAEMCGQNLSNDQQSAMYLRQIKALRLVFLLLPTTNYEILKRLLTLLHRVTAFQDVNKMSSLNLGTMFGPHILCPRKVSPNELQFLSASLSTAVAFIIENAPKLFEIPSELEIDVREYFRTSKIDRQLSKKSLEEAATKTTFSFVNRELTAKETNENITEMALAELYAYVRSLPDSAKKRKLIGQFNSASGQGTPKYSQSAQKKTEFSVKSLSDSIKKHLFSRSSKGLKSKKIPSKQMTIKRSNSEDILGRVMMTPRSRCPIIINSTSSLSSVAIQEESDNTSESKERKMFSSPNISETTVSKSTSHLDAHTPNMSSGKLDDRMLNRSNAKDDSRLSEVRHQATSHRLKGFFKYLSTSSLLQIASRLTSPSSVASDSFQNCTISRDENNESLTTVFKEYLLGRSILADTPEDISSRNIDDLSCDQSSTRIGHIKCLSADDSLNGSLVSKSKISNSLLFCLDGNNPFDDNRTPKRPSSITGEVHDDSPPKRCKFTDDEVAGNEISHQNALSPPKRCKFTDEVAGNKISSQNPLSPLKSSKFIDDEVAGNQISSQNQLSPLKSSKVTDDQVAGNEIGSQNPLSENINLNTTREQLTPPQPKLHSCSPNGRVSSLLKNRNGTPVPRKEKENDQEAVETTKSVLFETDL